MDQQKKLKRVCAQFGKYTSFVIFLDEMPIEVALTKAEAVEILARVPGATWRGYVDSKEAKKVLEQGPAIERTTRFGNYKRTDNEE